MGNPAESGLGGRTLGPLPQTCRPASHFWSGKCCKRSPRGQRTQRVSESSRSPESDSGTLFLLMVDLQKNNFFFFQFEPVKQTRAKSSQSLVLAHRPPRPEAACFPAGRAADAPGSYLPPASRLPVQPPRFGAGRQSRTETPTSSLRGRAGTRVGPRISTPRPPGAARPLPRPVLPR